MLALKRAADGKITGDIQAVGELPSFMDEIEDNRIPFPRTKFQRAQVA
jgi:pilus assembly protein CpaF